MILEIGLAETAAMEPKMAELEPFVKAQYPLILNLCQKRTGHAEEATDVAQASISKFLKEIYIYVRGRSPASVKYPAWHKFRNPEAWLTRIVMNACKDFLRNRSRRRKSFHYVHELPQPSIDEVDEDLIDRNPLDSLNESTSTPFRNRERYLLSREQRASDRAFVQHYRVALARLSVPRRRAWVLCNDEFLEPHEAENLLKLKSARAAKTTWPKGMPIKDAARILRCAEGTVSSNVSRARDDLRRELADLDPLKASRAPAPKWHEFLSGSVGVRGSLEQIDFAITPFLGPLPVKVPGGPVVQTWSASDFIIDYARAISRPLQIPANQERVSEPTQEIEHNSRPRRVNLPFPKGLKKISYRCGSYMKGCRNCGETKWIRTKKGKRKRRYKSGYAVFRSYAPSQTGWTFWCYECGAKDERCWGNCRDELGHAAVIRPKSALVYKDLALGIPEPLTTKALCRPCL